MEDGEMMVNVGWIALDLWGMCFLNIYYIYLYIYTYFGMCYCRTVFWYWKVKMLRSHSRVKEWEDCHGFAASFRRISSMNWSAADCKSMMMVMKKRNMKMNTTAIITINYIWYNKLIYIYICTYLKVPRTIEAIPQLMIIWILSFLFVSKRCGSWNPMGFWTSKFCKTLRLQDFITDENQEFEHRISAAASETRSFGNPVIRRSWCFTKKNHRKMRHFWPWRSF